MQPAACMKSMKYIMKTLAVSHLRTLQSPCARAITPRHAPLLSPPPHPLRTHHGAFNHTPPRLVIVWFNALPESQPFSRNESVSKPPQRGGSVV